jgi:hypothetical protein
MAHLSVYITFVGANMANVFPGGANISLYLKIKKKEYMY